MPSAAWKSPDKAQHRGNPSRRRRRSMPESPAFGRVIALPALRKTEPSIGRRLSGAPVRSFQISDPYHPSRLLSDAIVMETSRTSVNNVTSLPQEENIFYTQTV